MKPYVESKKNTTIGARTSQAVVEVQRSASSAAMTRKDSAQLNVPHTKSALLFGAAAHGGVVTVRGISLPALRPHTHGEEQAQKSSLLSALAQDAASSSTARAFTEQL